MDHLDRHRLRDGVDAMMLARMGAAPETESPSGKRLCFIPSDQTGHFTHQVSAHGISDTAAFPGTPRSRPRPPPTR